MFKEKNNKYGIRKLSVGVGSIVIGLVISSPIYADTNDIKSELSNFVSTKYYGTDTDNDGIIDKYDKDPLKWNVTDRDLRLFTELAYRSSDELTKIFNEDQTAIADFNSAKLLNVTDVSEITSDWHFVKQINHDNGFSASIFSNGRDAVVAIAGTNDANDTDDDLNIFNGAQPGQVNNIREIVDELSAYDNYYLTGHSLGGYLAVYLASSYLYNNEHLKHVAVFNAPGIKDSWSWISGNLFHRTTSANSVKLTDKFAAPTISNDEDSRNLSTEGFIQPYGINGDTVAGLYYYGNTRWNDRINSGSKHSSTNFFGTKQDENFKKWFSTGYRLDAPYLSADSDFDGLTDKDELAIGTDLNSIDSDNDGYGDKIELASGTNPLDASSSPKLNEFYYSAVTKGLTFKTPSEIQKNTLLSVAATTLDVYFENYKNQIPVLQSSEVTYSILNEPTDWKEIPGEYDLLLQARYKDNSLSNVFKLPIKIVLNQLRDEYKEKITNLSNLTESEKTDFINELNAVDAATFDEILLAATNLNESRTVAPDNPTTEEPGQPEVPVEQPTEEPGKPELPVEQIGDMSILRELVAKNVKNSGKYYNSSPEEQKDYQAALTDVENALYQSNLTQTQIDELVNRYNQMLEQLTGKATDFTNLTNSVNQSDALKTQAIYKNADLVIQKNYDVALTEAQKVVNNSSATQAQVDTALVKLQNAEAALNGKELSATDQERFDMLREAQELKDYYTEMLPYAGNMKSIVEFGIKSYLTPVLQNPQRYTNDAMRKMLNNAHMYDMYIQDAIAKIESKKALEEATQRLEEFMQNDLTILDKLEQAKTAVESGRKNLADPNQAYQYATIADIINNVYKDAKAAQEKAAQDQAEHDLRRQAALAELMEKQVKGTDTYVQLVDPDKNTGELTTTLTDVVKRAELVKEILPNVGAVVMDPEYNQYKTIEEYLQVGTPTYDKMKAAYDTLKESIQAELDKGLGGMKAMFGGTQADRYQYMVKTVPTDEQVAALKPLIDLADAYTKRSLEDINRMRFAIGLYPYEMAPISDKRKAMLIVHALTEYLSTFMKEFNGYNHLGTVANHLVPHQIVRGSNENMYPGSNAPVVSQHMTPEYMADMNNAVILMEGIAHYEKFFEDNKGLSGHFTNIIDSQMKYYYAALIPDNIQDKDYGYKSYRNGMTSTIYRVADEKYKELLKHFGEWPYVNPETDLDKTFN